MSGRFFLDTNVLVSTFDRSDSRKQVLAFGLVAEAINGNGCLSWQVVQEFSNVALGRMKAGFTPSTLADYQSQVLFPLCKLYPDARLFTEALRVVEDTGYSWYDSLIVASALRLGCSILYSEDLQHGRVLAGMTIVNPFL